MPDNSNKKKGEIPDPSSDGIEQSELSRLEKEAIESDAQQRQLKFLAQFSTFSVKAMSIAWFVVMCTLFLGLLVGIVSVVLFYFTPMKFIDASHADAVLRFMVDGVIANALYNAAKNYGPRLAMLGDPFRENSTY